LSLSDGLHHFLHSSFQLLAGRRCTKPRSMLDRECRALLYIPDRQAAQLTNALRDTLLNINFAKTTTTAAAMLPQASDIVCLFPSTFLNNFECFLRQLLSSQRFGYRRHGQTLAPFSFLLLLLVFSVASHFRVLISSTIMSQQTSPLPSHPQTTTLFFVTSLPPKELLKGKP